MEPAAAILRRFCTGGMSLGALSREAHETIAVAMARIHGRANSGEGGEDAERDAVIDDVDAEGRSARFPHLQGLENGDRAASQIRQVASGRFGVTTAYLAGAEQLEIKVAQGAKPGEGGELPGDKVTAYIAGLRRAAPGVTLISPPPHHDIYSIEDLAELIYDLRMVNPRAGISVKLVAGTGIGTIAAGVAKAGADVIHVSGHGGGTAAASLNSIKHAGIPWELGLAEVHRALVAAGFREHVRLRVDGDLRNGHDVVVAAALGADEFAFGTAVLLAEGCVMARVCHQNKCPVGVATQDPELRKRFGGKPEHIVNYFTFVAEEVRELLAGLGLRSLDELVGRAEFLELAEATGLKTDGLDRYWFEAPDAGPGRAASRRPQPVPAPGGARGCAPPVSPGRPCDTLDDRLLADPEVAAAVAGHGRVTRRETVVTRDRAVGARLAGEVAARHGDHGFGGEVRLELAGSAGQSLGAFLTDGLVVELTRRGQRLRRQGHGRRRARAPARGAAPRRPGQRHRRQHLPVRRDRRPLLRGRPRRRALRGAQLGGHGRGGGRRRPLLRVHDRRRGRGARRRGPQRLRRDDRGRRVLPRRRRARLARRPPDGRRRGHGRGRRGRAHRAPRGARGPHRQRGRRLAAGRPGDPRRPLRPRPSGARSGPPRGTAAALGHGERGASVTQAQRTLVAYVQAREYAPGEIRGAGVGPATCPERRPHGDRGLLRQMPHQAHHEG